MDLNGSKIVGKLIQNIFLGSFIFGCVIKPGPAGVTLCALRFELGVHIGTYLLTNSVSHTSLIVTIHGFPQLQWGQPISYKVVGK